jgi:hypothetical protein
MTVFTRTKMSQSETPKPLFLYDKVRLNVKIKLALEEAMKAQRGVEV